MTSTLERELREAGRPVATCPECGRAFDPSLDYDGHRGTPARATCSGECRRVRGNRLARRLRDYRRTTAGLADLPPMPEPPPADAAP